MKRAILAVVLMLGLGLSFSAFADNNDIKERRERNKELRKELKEKVDKETKKEAKRLEKEGWKVAPGKLPLVRQLDKLYLMQADVDDYGYPKFLLARTQAVGGNYQAALSQATAYAREDIAGQIETQIGALVENSMETKQLDNGDATSITRSLSSGKQFIKNKLGRLIPVMELCRSTKSGGYEVSVALAYNFDMAKTVAKEAIQADLEKRGDKLAEELDKMLGW